MNNFAELVFEIVRQIPKGNVATYSQIANLAKNPKAFRAVGQALNRNPTPITIPCHRVVRSNGDLGGYEKGVSEKIRLLKKEGIEIQAGKIDLASYGWQQS